LAILILLENTKEGQLKIKEQNDTDNIKPGISVMQLVQCEGILKNILENGKKIQVKITRIK